MKTPTAKGSRGLECFADRSNASTSTIAMQAQFIAARYAISPQFAATIASLAFGGHRHG